VIPIYHALLGYDSIAEYIEQDIHKIENKYIMTKSKIRDLLKDEESAQSASTKICWHDEWQPKHKYAEDYASGIR